MSVPTSGSKVVTAIAVLALAIATMGGFLFRRAAGIDALTPGFERILIRPVLDPRIRWCGADYDSVMGRISTDWSQNEDGSLALQVVIPANTTARVHLPAKQQHRILEGRRDVSHSRGVRILQHSGSAVTLEIGSGSYRFLVQT